MVFYPFEISIPHILYACLGGFVVIFGMFSLLLREKLYIGEACWAFIFGVIIGPYGANIFNPRGWGNGDEVIVNEITLELSRVVLAIGVFAIGVELPKQYMKKHWKSLFFLLGPVMIWGWFVSAAFIFALVPKLNFLASLAVAACLTPTDPILAQAVIGGKYADKHVPAHLRHLLAAESGCNDGAAFPFLYIALYLILDQSTGSAIRDWFLILWLYEVVLGIAIGAAVGFGFRYLMKFCEKRDLMDRHSYVAQYVSLALFTVGVTCLLGSDDLLSTFACGTAFAWDGFFNKQTEESVFSSVIDLLFNIAAFVYVGAWMPFSSFQNEELTLSVWRLVVIAILVLLFRRLPVMIALYKWIPDVKTFREAVFSGHFGPIGIGAVFISTLAAENLHEDTENEQAQLLARTIQPIVAFMILCSILIHGLSIPSFSLGRRVHSVSRTWSKHTTIGGGQSAPDWTNQARLVERGEDIVINRDPDRERDEVDGMERGELTPTEKGSDVDEKEKEKEPREGAGEVLAEGETPPDGDEIESEWQEGPHRVIERRKGPGEEVEVEVIRNYGSSKAKSSSFRGPRSSAYDQLHAHLHKLRHFVDEEEGKAKKVEKQAEHKVEEAAHEVEHKIAESPLLPASSAASPPPPPRISVEGSAIADDDDEEDWASDEDPSPSSATEIVSRHDESSAGGSRSKSPKVKHSHSHTASSKKPKGSGMIGLGMGRRRNSIRKGLLTTGSGFKPAVEERRGRSDEPVRFADGQGPKGKAAAKHLRLDTIRAQDATRREASPARSVRFMDEEREQGGRSSGTSTPRYSSVFHHGSPVVGESSVPGTPANERADSGGSGVKSP